ARVVEISAPANDKYDEALYTLTAHSFRSDRYERIDIRYPSLASLDDAVKLRQKPPEFEKEASSPSYRPWAQGRWRKRRKSGAELCSYPRRSKHGNLHDDISYVASVVDVFRPAPFLQGKG